MSDKINPITKQPYSEKYNILKKSWMNYSTYLDRENIKNKLRDNNVLTIVSPTGSGKSVITPRIVSEFFNYEKKIVLSLPKQIITTSLAKYVAETMDVELGKFVGFKHGNDKKVSDETKILFATDGTVLEMILNDPLLLDYSCVIIDEAHERNERIDFMIFLLRSIINVRTDFKVVIMSATINLKLFDAYFKKFKIAHIELGGTRFKINQIFSEKKVFNEYKESLLIIDKIISSGQIGDILVFVSSIVDTLKMCRDITQKYSDVFCTPLYGGVSIEIEDIAKDPEKYKMLGNYKRKIVIATEVAESSITIEGLSIVIDNGKSNQMEYDPIRRANVMENKYITKSQITQRMGRVGRTREGTCYHLYTKSEYDEFLDYPLTQIRTMNISELIMKLLKIPDLDSIEKVIKALENFIEPPTKIYMKSAIDQLTELGIMDDKKLSKLGISVIKLREIHDIHCAIALIYSILYKCSKDMLVIIGLYLACNGKINKIFQDDREHASEIDEIKKKFASKSGDFIALGKIYKTFQLEDSIEKFCEKYYVNYKVLYRAKEDIENIKHRLEKYDDLTNGLEIDKEFKENEIVNRILHCLHVGYKNQKATLDGDKYIIKYSDGKTQSAKMGRDSCFSMLEIKPKEIYYAEYFIMSGRHMINTLTL